MITKDVNPESRVLPLVAKTMSPGSKVKYQKLSFLIHFSPRRGGSRMVAKNLLKKSTT